MSVQIESDLLDGYLERWLQSEWELEQFVERFLLAELPLSDWTHRAHVGVAAALVTNRGEETALQILEEAIPRFNVRTGGANTESSGYHQTLTVFWVQRVAAMCRRLPAAWSRLDRVRAVVEAYGEMRRLDRVYYSFDVVRSTEARMTWVKPDR